MTMSTDTLELIKFIREVFGASGIVPLHEPFFCGNEKKYLNDCIDSTFVSSVGKYVTQFEEMVAEYTGARYAVATVNGTAALHIALLIAGVKGGDEVITQPLSFIATCNAISYCGARPIFIDVDLDNLGMSPGSLRRFLEEETIREGQAIINKKSGKKISSVVPMHTFGHPCRINEIKKICDEFSLPLIEDAAESLGSFIGNKHSGLFGLAGALSFNGNKIMTTGGGGMIITDDESLARRAKHLTTTAKVPHKYEFAHDEVGYNYRMPNLNAALGCAQVELLPKFLSSKRDLAARYSQYFRDRDQEFIDEPDYARSNFWLNAISLKNKSEMKYFLEELNNSGIQSRPIWQLMPDLPMFDVCQVFDGIRNARMMADRVINLPSSVRVC